MKQKQKPDLEQAPSEFHLHFRLWIRERTSSRWRTAAATMDCLGLPMILVKIEGRGGCALAAGLRPGDTVFCRHWINRFAARVVDRGAEPAMVWLAACDLLSGVFDVTLGVDPFVAPPPPELGPGWEFVEIYDPKTARQNQVVGPKAVSGEARE